MRVNLDRDQQYIIGLGERDKIQEKSEDDDLRAVEVLNLSRMESKIRQRRKWIEAVVGEAQGKGK